MDALKRPTQTKRQGRVGQTSYTNVHKANLESQLSIFDTASFAWVALTQTTRPNGLTRMPSNDPPERIYMGDCTTQMKR